MIAIENLVFAYGKNQHPILDGLTYTFLPGTVTALTGESGRGKTTLLYMLGLLLRPTSGGVNIRGREVGALADSQRSRMRNGEIGFIFQDASLDPSRTVLDSVIEPTLYAGGRRAQSVKRAIELLEEFDVGSRATHRPGQISGGQAQRVAICRALMNEPHIILADEPTGNLDEKNSELVLDILTEQATMRGRTVIIATHDPQVLSRVNAVLEV